MPSPGRKASTAAVPVHAVRREHVFADDGYVGPGYGLPTPGMVDALTLLALTGGNLLDPVYSGKAMAGMIDHIRKGTFGSNEDIIFLHAGGSTALSGDKHLFLKA